MHLKIVHKYVSVNISPFRHFLTTEGLMEDWRDAAEEKKKEKSRKTHEVISSRDVMSQLAIDRPLGFKSSGSEM